MNERTPLTIDALILAAGSSSRLGQPKQTVRLFGRTLLQRVARLALDTVNGEVNVVAGAHAATDRRSLADTGARVHTFDNWQQGQGASLAHGLALTGHCDGVLVLPVDQYRLRAEDVRGLISQWRRWPQRPAAARYQGTIGVPVVWPRADCAALIEDRRPGRSRLMAGRCTTVDLPRAAFDLDTPADLAALRAYERDGSG